MTTSLLERLPRLVAQGRRQAQRLADSAAGRNRERAVPVEWIDARRAHSTHDGMPPRRVLCGAPALSVAALLAEHRQGGGTRIGRIVVDLRPAGDSAAMAARLARWTTCLALLRTLAPTASLELHTAPDEASIMRLVFDAFSLRDVGQVVGQVVGQIDDAADATTLLLAEGPKRLVDLADADARWIACVDDERACAALRRALLLRGDCGVRIEEVGAAPLEWTRRNAAAQPLGAMQSALGAYGAKPLAQTVAAATPMGRRRAGADVLLGESRRDGDRALVWVESPDRRTGEATLCRAITRREHGAYDRVVLLCWHLAPTLGQHLAVRGDSRMQVHAIRCFPRGERNTSLRVDPHGFAPIQGLARAWVERERSRGAPDHEWLLVQLGEDHGEPVVDWSIDWNHDGQVFHGGWHALRDAPPGTRSVRVRLPWHEGPRRVCIRAIGVDGRASELLYVVHAKLERTGPEPRGGPERTVPARVNACTRSEPLC